VAEGLFLRLQTFDGTGITQHTGYSGGFIDVNIDIKADNALASHARLAKNPISVHQAMRLCHDEQGATILTEYHRQKTDIKCHVMYPACAIMKSYVATDVPERFDAAKPSLSPFMDPIMDGAYVPRSCKENDQAAVNGRVLDVRKPDMKMTPIMQRCMLEFAKLIYPDNIAGTLHPVDPDTVWANQARPTQRSILADASNSFAFPDGVQCFMKAESGNSCPRIISTIPPDLKLNLSQYVYAQAAHLKQFDWYAFGKTPERVAELVANLCRSANAVFQTDYSRLDGRMNNLMAVLCRIVMMRGFSSEHLTELSELLSRTYNNKARTRHGVKFDTASSVSSGKPNTSSDNTLVTAYMSYFKARTERTEDGRFRTPQEAWATLGIYGGDDGVAKGDENDLVSLAKASAKCGHVLTGEVVHRGKPGVSFLARIYGPGVWTGDPSSMADIIRTASKLHLSKTLPTDVTPVMKLVEKIRPLLHSDMNTPLLGDLAHAVNRLIEIAPVSEADSRIVSWNGRFETGYPNDNDGGWMEEIAEQAFLNYNIDGFRSWIENVTNIDELMHCPMFGEDEKVSLKIPAIVNGVIHLPDLTTAVVTTAKPSTAIVESAPKRKSAPKKRGKQAGKRKPPGKGGSR